MLAGWLLIIGGCYDNSGCDASGGSLSEFENLGSLKLRPLSQQEEIFREKEFGFREHTLCFVCDPEPGFCQFGHLESGNDTPLGERAC
jgi:hypothetical protein